MIDKFDSLSDPGQAWHGDRIAKCFVLWGVARWLATIDDVKVVVGNALESGTLFGRQSPDNEGTGDMRLAIGVRAAFTAGQRIANIFRLAATVAGDPSLKRHCHLAACVRMSRIVAHAAKRWADIAALAGLLAVER